jgi:hypothetical protein
MSMAAFIPFIGVSVAENGTGKPIAALNFEPTPATARRLADYRLIFRPRAGGFQLYARNNPAAGNARLAPITARAAFVFSVRTAEADFLTRYHPDLDPATGPNLYLSNLNADGTARPNGQLSLGATVEQADAARIVGRRLNARADLAAPTRPTSLKVTDRYAAARTVADVPVFAAAGSESASVAIDLTGDAASAYTLSPQPSGAKTMLFADDELAGLGALGALQLIAEPFPGPDPAAGRAYTAIFRRRS